MPRPKKPQIDKPAHVIGQEVTIDFLGTKRSAVITDGPYKHNDAWVYSVLRKDGIVVPYVGVNGEGEFANIIDT
jgi:hypothetical protein